ncbi:WhiB family transcriptional regulator [Streptomyces sp. MS06]|uniref:WhiB family transcriptional regulator n=1 Tax=Streptomyces sp. MS06 TaxID=3385974 RepID=UPI00399F2920
MSQLALRQNGTDSGVTLPASAPPLSQFLSYPPQPSGPPDRLPWQAAAACAGLPAAVVFSRRPSQAAPALRACRACPVRRRCEEVVSPAESWFDGVCAGRLWRNGRPVAVRDDPSGAVPPHPHAHSYPHSHPYPHSGPVPMSPPDPGEEPDDRGTVPPAAASTPGSTRA